MTKIDDLLSEWATDSKIDRTEPGKALIDIPKLHSKYLNILSKNKLLCKESEFKYSKMKKIKWEYYTGKMGDDDLKKYGWNAFPFTIKSEISIFMESDDDLNKLIASKMIYEEVVSCCELIMKELHSRTFQLKTFVDWEKFIQGI